MPGDLRDLISTTITGKDRNCGPAERVYADNFPICYHRAAYLKITDPKAYPEFDRWLNQTGCRDPFLRCHISKTVTRVCTPLHSMFNRHVDELARALTDTAAIYTRSFIPYMENNGFACDRDAYQIGIDRFIGECENALQKQIPLFGDGTWGNCRPGGAQQLWSKETAAKAACSKAVRQVALSPANVVNETDFAAPLLRGTLSAGTPSSIRTASANLGPTMPRSTISLACARPRSRLRCRRAVRPPIATRLAVGH